ncbi:WD40-repeat-containing domain protein [Globomyces pollinis-pini]|nr:WD40-repeat-containing domain protein [Globomyces pollinis-pini]
MSTGFGYQYPSFNKLSSSLPQSKSKDFIGHKDKVHTIDWSCDGRRLASGSVDKTARVWSVERSVSDSIVLKGHEDAVYQLAWNPQNQDSLATASVDKSVRVWDIKSGKSNTFKTDGENINICWSPEGKVLAVGDKNDRISFIDTRGGSDSKGHTYIIKTLKNEIETNEISWNYAGDLFFLTTGQGNVKILEYPSLEEAYILSAHTSNCSCITFDPRGRYMATGGADAMVSLWDLENLLCLQTYSRLDGPIRAISFSYDGELIASCSEDCRIEISHVESGDPVHTIKTTSSLNSVAWHPSKYLLAYACDEKDKNTIGDIHVFGY